MLKTTVTTDQRVTSLEQKFGSIENKLDILIAGQIRIEERLTSLEKRMDAVESRLDQLEKRMSKVEKEIRKISKEMKFHRESLNIIIAWVERLESRVKYTEQLLNISDVREKPARDYLAQLKKLQ